MWIELDYSPDFRTLKVQEFLRDANSIDYSSPAPIQPGFAVISSRQVGEQPLPTPLFTFVKETYSIVQGRNTIGKVDATIPIAQDLGLGIVSHLLLAERLIGSDAERHVLDAFQQYDEIQHGDASVYAHSKLDGVVDENDYLVLNSFTLRKTAAARENATQRQALFDLYGGQIDGQINLGNGEVSLRETFQREGYRLILISKHFIDQPIVAVDSHIIETDQITDPVEDTINELIRVESYELDCGIVDTVEGRVCTLVQWPEFKIEWEPRRIKIGCVKITLILPILYIRTTKLALWYYYGKLPHADVLLVNIMQSCAIKSVVAGAIIGIALTNIQAALITFRTVFIECVKASARNVITCLIPGLLLQKERGEWDQV